MNTHKDNSASDAASASGREVLGALAGWGEQYAPTEQELADMVDKPYMTTRNLLQTLRRRGLVDWRDGQRRTLHLTDAGRAALARQEAKP